ncbi:MAG: 30S ribosomal protein S2 [Planctomycetota bacterium]
MASALVRGLIESGIHFGHQVARWNPRMAPFIFTKRNSIHIIDIRETVRGLLRAKKFLAAVISQGQDVLIVGTKRQARDIVAKQALRVGMHYVNERWLGGTLTNFKTIRSRLARLETLEALETTGKIKTYTKKEAAVVNRERKKITRNLDGIRRMTKLPGVLVILDVRREHIAVKEAKKLGIPTICLVDTDSDPTVADIIIPGNDDAMRAIELIVTELADAVDEGKRSRPQPSDTADDALAGAGGARPRRSQRMTTSQLAEAGSMPVEAMAAPVEETAAVQVPDGV